MEEDLHPEILHDERSLIMVTFLAGQ